MTSWVRLDRKFDWRVPGKRAMKAFPAGDHFMTDEQADEAERVGAGVRIDKPAGKKTSKAGYVVDKEVPDGET